MIYNQIEIDNFKRKKVVDLFIVIFGLTVLVMILIIFIMSSIFNHLNFY